MPDRFGAKSPSLFSCLLSFITWLLSTIFRRSTYESQGHKNEVYNTQNFEI